MRTTQFPSEALAELIRAQKIATMGQLADTLGTDVKRTVFRKLKELGYRTSYSHRGSYYTLDDVADFDDDGLWSYRSVWFSTHGTLLATVEAMVDAGELGHFLDELDNMLHVAPRMPCASSFETAVLAGRRSVAGTCTAPRSRTRGGSRCWRARGTPNAPWAARSRSLRRCTMS